MLRPRARRPSLFSRDAVLILLSVLIPAVLLAIALGDSWRGATLLASQRVERTADTMHQHVLKVFETQDLALDRVADYLAARDPGAIHGPELGAMLEAITGKLEHTVSMWVSDAEGAVIAASHSFNPANRLTVHAFWRRLRDGDVGTVIGDPLIGRTTGLRSFPVGRRRPSQDGTFHGTIHVALMTDYFSRVFARLAAEAPLDAVLTRRDGTVLVAYPPGAAMTPPSRFSVVRDMQNHDARLTFSIPERVVRDGWIEDARRIGIASGAAFLALAAAAALALRQSRARLLALEALRHEITVRTETEEKLRDAVRLEAIGRITGGVAHDFNNLLTTVMVSLDLIEARARLDGQSAAHLSSARQAAETGAHLVASLLAYARGQVLAPAPHDVARLVEGMLPLMRNAAGHGIAITFRHVPSLAPCLVDAAQMHSAMLNLVVNARDAMASGGRIAITIHPATLDAAALAGNAEAQPGPFIAVTVTDTGAGIATEHLPRVFEPFFTTKAMGKGTGLGLAQVFGFARQSAGHVRIESTPGAGTRVTMFLPMTDAPPLADAPPVSPETGAASMRILPPQPPPAEAPPPTVPAPRQGRILVVDDNAAIRDLARRILTDAGHDVTMCDSGDAAVALIDAGTQFDLLLSDVVMPGERDGLALAAHATAVTPGVPVVLMSGYMPGVEGLARTAGWFIAKPFSRRALLDTVTSALDRETAAART
ncbi:ATP-binding protein [Elioraea sp.]|uniref:ATP-binding protein n=1 Tax=Elioraea sp. TaxID=2185103 RepID=UPI0025C2CC83|nr:ATP-binding protein [Elioraea sp.]